MRSPRKNSTYRRSGAVTTSQTRPADIARLQATARAKRKVYDTTVFDDPPGLTPIPKLDGTTETQSMTPDSVENFVRAQERNQAQRFQSTADRLWGSATR